MIFELEHVQAAPEHDVCVVGSGPLGLALAFACADEGLRVLILESGLRERSDAHNSLGDGDIAHPAAHASLIEANCRQLGGTSNYWGGRCVPFDPIDFEQRPFVAAANWPIGHDEMARWHGEAASFFGIGTPEFSRMQPWPAMSDVRSDQRERWAPEPRMGVRHEERLRTADNISVLLDATVTDMHFEQGGSRITGVTVSNGRRTLQIASPTTVIACGAVQTARLLLNVQARNPSLFGGQDGPLGRRYMGHIFGKIADLVLNDPHAAGMLDYVLEDGIYSRGRLSIADDAQRREQLLQISFSAGNAAISDVTHRNGVLSAIWLVLASPLGKRLLPDALRRIYVGEGRKPWGAHLGNIMRRLPQTIYGASRIFYDRVIRKPGKPSVFLWSKGGRYTIHYHSEQSPDASNRIVLSEGVDACGMRRARVEFVYSRADAERIVRAHEVLDQNLRAAGIGRLDFAGARETLVDKVLEQARDGLHQIGGAPMSDDPAQGVVDRDCRVHGVENLFLATTGVLPSSSHANPTFAGAALAIRLGHHIAAASRAGAIASRKVA